MYSSMRNFIFFGSFTNYSSHILCWYEVILRNIVSHSSINLVASTVNQYVWQLPIIPRTTLLTYTY